jgi:hypothetical protein
MNINLHIDRIILDGLDVDPMQASLLQSAVTTQITKLLTEHGVVSPPTVPDHRGLSRTNSFRFGLGANASSLGPQLASAIYAGIAQSQIIRPATQGAQP